MGTAWSEFIDDSTKSKEQVYEMVKWQNQMMEVESAKQCDKYSTDNARIKFISQDIMGWNQVNFILWLIYYVVFIVTLYLLYNKQSELIVLTKNQKIYLGFIIIYHIVYCSSSRNIRIIFNIRMFVFWNFEFSFFI